MRIHYDKKEDALSLVFGDSDSAVKDLGGGVSVDYDTRGQLARIQIQNASLTSAGKDVFRQIVVDGIGPFVQEQQLIIVPRLFGNSEILD